MIGIIPGIVLIVLLCLAIRKPDSKITTYIILLYMFVMFAFMYYTGDLLKYEAIFNKISAGDTEYKKFEIGFIVLFFVFSKLGVSFVALRAFLGALYVGLSYNAVRRFTDKTALAMIVLTIFPLFIFVSIIRAGIASVIVLNACYYLTQNNAVSKKKFAILILIAGLFHQTAFFFIILMFMNRKMGKREVAVLVALSVAMVIMLQFTDVIPQILDAVNMGSKSYVFNNPETASNINGIIAIVIALGANLLLAVAADYAESSQSSLQLINCNISIVFVLLTPLMAVAVPFMRLPYMIYGMNVVSYIEALYDAKEEKRITGKTMHIGLVVLFGVTLLWALYFDYPYLKDGGTIYTNLIHMKFA